MKGVLLILIATSLLAGCSWFGNKDEVVIEPAKLERFSSERTLKPLWSVKVGAGAADKAIRLEPGLSGNRVFAASASGQVIAVDQSTGRKIWQQDIRALYTRSEVKRCGRDHGWSRRR